MYCRKSSLESNLYHRFCTSYYAFFVYSLIYQLFYSPLQSSSVYKPFCTLDYKLDSLIYTYCFAKAFRSISSAICALCSNFEQSDFQQLLPSSLSLKWSYYIYQYWEPWNSSLRQVLILDVRYFSH